MTVIDWEGAYDAEWSASASLLATLPYDEMSDDVRRNRLAEAQVRATLAQAAALRMLVDEVVELQRTIGFAAANS